MDENWNVKVADFGFARIKEENATMTRCGTPSWTGLFKYTISLTLPFCVFHLLKLLLRCTAPEVIKGEKYGEAADIYSFGIIMWEVRAAVVLLSVLLNSLSLPLFSHFELPSPNDHNMSRLTGKSTIHLSLFRQGI